MLPDRVSNPGPLTYESGALPIALRGPAAFSDLHQKVDFSRKIYENHDLDICSKLYFQVTHSPKQGVFQGAPLRPPAYQIEFN